MGTNSYAVIGAGFGDEGKGKVTDYLCSKLPNPIVIRFSGGHQAAHQVITEDGRQHVFSHFGSGTLRGIPTYWSRYCTVSPVALLNEYSDLKKKKCEPQIYIDSKSPIITPFDIGMNRKDISDIRNGSCGVGIGQTWAREERFRSLLFEDLFDPIVFKIKFNIIKDYYNNYIHIEEDEISDFIKSCEELIHLVHLCVQGAHGIKIAPISLLTSFSNRIFEGSQGLLLDQDIGFFPHVTRSNTDLTNIVKLGIFDPRILLVTRAYQTRHGNGPMTNLDIPYNIELSSHEKNIEHPYQGEFRKSMLDINLLKYGIDKSKFCMNNHNTSLVMTCIDNLQESPKLTIDGDVFDYGKNAFIKKIQELLFKRVYISESPVSTELELLNK